MQQGKPTLARKKTPRVPWAGMLNSRPVRNDAADVNTTEKGLTITVDNKRPWFFFPPISWILRIPRKRSFALDDLGLDVWEWCDGNTSVEKMAERFSEKNELTFHEARVMVGSYLRLLSRRGAVVIVVRDKDLRKRRSKVSA